MKLYILEPESNVSERLGAVRDVQVIGSADSVVPAEVHFPEHDLLLLSAAFPSCDVSRFLCECPEPAGRTVIVEMDEEPERIVPFLESGAAGYVRRGASAAEMISTLREIHSGRSPLAPHIGDALLERMHELLALQKQRTAQTIPTGGDALKTLTLRERQVLTLIRNGSSNQEIANQLLIELGTVKNHVHNILKKLKVTRREQAAQYVNLLEQIG